MMRQWASIAASGLGHPDPDARAPWDLIAHQVAREFGAGAMEWDADRIERAYAFLVGYAEGTS